MQARTDGSDAERIAHADAFFAATGAVDRMANSTPRTAEGRDHGCHPSSFVSREAYYATLAHELTWTKHKSRLDRDLGRKTWGDEGYAKEELVAELVPAFLCADLGLTPSLAPTMPPIPKLVEGAEERQACDLLRSGACSKGRRFSARVPANPNGSRSRCVSGGSISAVLRSDLIRILKNSEPAKID